MTAVQTSGLTHIYSSSRRGVTDRRVLSNLNMTVDTGEIFGLLGPNGGGKTTLFRILSTALVPSQGKAFICGRDVVEESSEARRKMGVVFQNPSLDKKLTLFENLIHQGHLYGLSGLSLADRTKKTLAHLGVETRADDIVETLSGGLQRRGEIAKGLLHKPELMIMDEPGTGLDPGARRDLWSYLAQLKKEGITILLTTHLMEEAEKCDRVAILHKGSFVAVGAPTELKGKIGGDVIHIQSKEADHLAQKIKEKFGKSCSVMDNAVRMEIKDGHKFIPVLIETFPGLIESVSLGKPTLEDVFTKETGQRFTREDSL